MTASALGAELRLARWLGPWASGQDVPAGVRCEVLSFGSETHARRLQTFVYRARAEPRGSILVANGLNPWGPLDPRADRFARILAHAGFLVAAPALPDFLRLRCVPEAVDDFAAVFDALLAYPRRPRGRLRLLSISFGSLPLLSLLADRSRSAQVAQAIVFGGYADPAATLRYCLGEAALGSPPPDPLNMPAVATNLVDVLPLDVASRERVCAAWLELARATWGRPELKARARHAPIGEAIAARLPVADRELFLRGAGLRPDGVAFFRAALARADERLSSIDPRRALARASHPLPPVHLMHGRDDDVIPLRELDALAAALARGTRVARHVTGLYGHTQTTGVVRQLPLLLEEGRTFVQMLRALAGAAGEAR